MIRSYCLFLLTLSCSLAFAQFTPVNSGFPPLGVARADWGDYDNDGDLDCVVIGYDVNNYMVHSQYTRIWKNSGDGSFSVINPGLLNICGGSVEWGDYDNDGSLDIVMTGTSGYQSTATYNAFVCHNNGNDSFTSYNAGLTSMTGTATWGDYDNDGWVDIIQAGMGPYSQLSNHLLHNNRNNTFSLTNSFNPPIQGPPEWGDYDNDGDLDILISGSIYGSPYRLAKIYRNDDNALFTDINAVIEPRAGSSAWGDYDNDGDLDILLCGVCGSLSSDVASRVYRNDGGNIFTDIGAGLQGIGQGSALWGDFDGDGDLDILITGTISTTYYPPGYTVWYDNLFTRIYRNDYNAINTPPTPPTNLQASSDGTYITFSWTSSTDTQTLGNGLNYALRIGTSSGACDILSPMSDAAGYRKVAKRGYVNGNCSWRIKASVLSGEIPYFWSVQAIDGAYAGSSFATEAIFVNTPLAPDTPSNITISRNGAEVVLDWDDVDNATNYHIYYSSEPDVIMNDWTELGFTESSMFTDSPTTGNHRFYKVTANNE